MISFIIIVHESNLFNSVPILNLSSLWENARHFLIELAPGKETSLFLY